MTLTLIQEKTKSEKNDSITFTTVYENEMYKAFFIEDSEELQVNVLTKEFKDPRIDVFSGSVEVNVAATGNLSAKQLNEHMQKLQVAYETINEIENLIKSYKYEK